MGNRIYCVEDDMAILGLMQYTLRTAGFESEGFPDADKFWSAIETEKPILILLDIMLPKEDGLSVLKKIKGNPETEEIPVIMTTAKSTEYDRVIGLDIGADDYLCKPFGMMEMISRVKAVLRRTAGKHSREELCSGPIVMSRLDHSVTVDGKQLKLTLKEFDVLKLFMENKGRVFARDQLFQAVWGADFYGETRTVDVHIGTLRTKLGTAGERIETVRSVGYRLRNDDE